MPTSSELLNLFSALHSLAAHNLTSEEVACPEPCFECEVQKLLSRCVEYGQRLRAVE